MRPIRRPGTHSNAPARRRPDLRSTSWWAALGSRSNQRCPPLNCNAVFEWSRAPRRDDFRQQFNLTWHRLTGASTRPDIVQSRQLFCGLNTLPLSQQSLFSRTAKSVAVAGDSRRCCRTSEFGRNWLISSDRGRAERGSSARVLQTSIFSAISIASSISMPN